MPPIWPHFFRGKLIFQVDCRRSRFDHGLHEFEYIQRPSEAGLGIRDDGREEIDVILALGMLDMIGALQRLIDSLHDMRNAVRRIETLVGIHLSGQVRVRRHLPSAEIDGLQSRFDLLDGLVAGQGPQRMDIIFRMKQIPQFREPRWANVYSIFTDPAISVRLPANTHAGCLDTGFQTNAPSSARVPFSLSLSS